MLVWEDEVKTPSNQMPRGLAGGFAAARCLKAVQSYDIRRPFVHRHRVRTTAARLGLATSNSFAQRVPAAGPHRHPANLVMPNLVSPLRSWPAGSATAPRPPLPASRPDRQDGE